MTNGFSRYARVIVLDIGPFPPCLRKILKRSVSNVHYYNLDLTDFASIQTTAEEIRKDHGHPSILINNAGTGATLIDADPKLTEKIFKENVACHFVLIKEFLPGMLAAKKGHIVTIASMASFFASSGIVDYCCTKTTPLCLHEGLRAELRDMYGNGKCIQQTCVHPNWYSTGMVKGYEEMARQAGIQMDPLTNVSNAVIVQVLANRSGEIFMPKKQRRRAGFRNWPLWAHDVTIYAYQTFLNSEF